MYKRERICVYKGVYDCVYKPVYKSERICVYKGVYDCVYKPVYKCVYKSVRPSRLLLRLRLRFEYAVKCVSYDVRNSGIVAFCKLF